MDPEPLTRSESALAAAAKRASALATTFEDLLFRAQRVARALRNKANVSDSMFGRDLQNFRSDVRVFVNDMGELSDLLAGVAQTTRFEAGAAARAEAVQRLSGQILKTLVSLNEQSRAANQHFRSAEHKSEAGYLATEIDALAQKAQSWPAMAEQVLARVRAAKPEAAEIGAGETPGQPASAAGFWRPQPKPRPAVSMRPIAASEASEPAPPQDAEPEAVEEAAQPESVAGFWRPQPKPRPPVPMRPLGGAEPVPPAPGSESKP